MSKAARGEELVTVTSGYGANTKRPYVALQIGDRRPHQWSPEEARRVALLLLGGAEAAEGDGFVVEWFTEKVGLEPRQAAGLLHDFRTWRDAHREEAP